MLLKTGAVLSTPFRLVVPRPALDAVARHALTDLPNECCGLLAGTLDPTAGPPLGRVLSFYELPNAAASPVEFWSDAKSMLLATRDIRTKGHEVLAVYHSHPASAPVPSRTDLARNFWPQAVCLIVSLAGPAPAFGAWWLREDGYDAADWEVVAEEAL